MVTVIAFGIAALFTQYPVIYFYLKMSGIAYLFYLSWKIANAGNASATNNIREPFTFLQAAAFQWFNPKAWVIGVGALAAFTTPENFEIDVVTIVLIYLLMGFLCMAVWLKLGHVFQQFLHGGKRVHYFNIVMGLLLALSVIPMAYTGIGELGN